MIDATQVQQLVSAVGVPTALLVFGVVVVYRHLLPMARELVAAHKQYLETTSRRIERIEKIDDKLDRVLGGEACRFSRSATSATS